MHAACAGSGRLAGEGRASARGRREGVSGVPRAERPARPSEQMIVPVQADLVHAPSWTMRSTSVPPPPDLEVTSADLARALRSVANRLRAVACA